MTDRLRWVKVLLLLIAFVATATPLTTQGGATKLKVAAAYPGFINDKAWNQSGFEALKLIEKELGAQIAYTEKVAQPDQVEVLSDYARRGFDLVFAHGGEFDEATKRVAAQFPKVKFATTNGRVVGQNLATVEINHWQVGYLVGVVAGMMTKTNKIAIVAAQKLQFVEDWKGGITQGAQAVNPKARVVISYTGNWDDASKGKEAALAQIANGADVLFPILDQAIRGIMSAAVEKNVYAVGQIGDQLDFAPKNVLTSGIENMSVAWLKLAKLTVERKFQGKHYVVGVETPGAAGLGRFGPMVPQNVKDRAEAARKALLAGTIKRQ